jgi:hypothetical protein
MSRALDLLASLVLEDGRRWGEVATDWQWADATAVLEPGNRGPRLHFETRPRGGSKTVDAAAMAAVALVEQVPPGARMYSFATDRDQARLINDALAGLVVRSGLSGLIKVDRFSATAASGATLEVLAADEASSYGLRSPFFLCDEVTLWRDKGVWVSIVSAVPKVPGCRLLAMGSAGDPAHWSYDIRERAQKSSAWRLSEVEGPLPWVTPEQLDEQRALLTTSQFDRLHLNRWTAGEDRLVSIENLRAAVTLDGPQDPRPGVQYRMGLDIGLTRDATACAVAHAEVDRSTNPPTRRLVLDRLVVLQGQPGRPVSDRDIEETVVSLWRTYNRPKLRADPFYAAWLVRNLRTRGVSVEPWSYTDKRYGQIASVLFAALRDRRIDLYDDVDLLDELRNVRLLETIPGQVRIQHDPGRHDDRCVAIGMAVVPLAERGLGGGSFAVAAGEIPTATTDRRAYKPPSEPPVPVVADGEPRPADRGPVRLGPGFAASIRRARGYRPPGSR